MAYPARNAAAASGEPSTATPTWWNGPVSRSPGGATATAHGAPASRRPAVRASPMRPSSAAPLAEPATIRSACSVSASSVSPRAGDDEAATRTATGIPAGTRTRASVRISLASSSAAGGGRATGEMPGPARQHACEHEPAPGRVAEPERERERVLGARRAVVGHDDAVEHQAPTGTSASTSPASSTSRFA